MLITHIYFNGNCKEAIELYKNALYADVKTLIEDSNSSLVVHAELTIHDGLLILNDFGNSDGVSKSGGYQLCLQFDNEDELKRAYSNMEFESITINPIQSTDYSPCTIRFEDRFGIRWAFWV
ncbi:MULTISPECIES: VOC family protein [unclassified Clostridioides]|uniref:VOC family protein n=1 Tax=unclassified Clostridioides TaxID=2635829 RepID=UPI0038A2B8CD